MHTATTARETLEILWDNYVTLSEEVDLDSMPSEKIDALKKQNPPVRPFRIAAWLTRQGFFISAWSLWEYYSWSLCNSLPNKEDKEHNNSTVKWVGRSLAANNIDFVDQEWFVGANSLRNLIAHNGLRAEGSRAKNNLEQSLKAFPDIETYQDGYVGLTHGHIAELMIKIESFIDETSSQIDES